MLIENYYKKSTIHNPVFILIHLNVLTDTSLFYVSKEIFQIFIIFCFFLTFYDTLLISYRKVTTMALNNVKGKIKTYR